MKGQRKGSKWKGMRLNNKQNNENETIIPPDRDSLTYERGREVYKDAKSNITCWCVEWRKLEILQKKKNIMESKRTVQ